jgi:hypothetical protein
MKKVMAFRRQKFERIKKDIHKLQAYNSYRGLILLLHDIGFIEVKEARSMLDRIDSLEYRIIIQT